MMGGVSPETCRAPYKYEIKILKHRCTLLDFLCEVLLFVLLSLVFQHIVHMITIYVYSSER